MKKIFAGGGSANDLDGLIASVERAGHNLRYAENHDERRAASPVTAGDPGNSGFGSTEGGFAVSVRDRFGRLDKSTILRYIDKCLHSSAQIDRKTYGAGLGLYLVMNAASHVVVNIAPGMATEVVCSFDRKGVRTGLRGFSIFVYPGEAVAAQQRG